MEIVFVIAMCILNKIILKKIDKERELQIKAIYWIYIFTLDIFIVIYLFDKFNIPSFFKMNQNIGSQNWLNNILSFISNIISATIGGIIAFGISKHQIDQNNKQNFENNRIQNMPMIKYDIKTGIKNKKIDSDNYISTKYENDTSKNRYDIFIEIKNIGLNNIKQVIVDLQSDCFVDNNRIVGEKTLVPIEKGEHLEIYKLFCLIAERDYKIILKVYYEDVLQNWYSQEVKIKYTTSNVVYNGKIGIVNYIVDEEILIDKENIPK